MSDDLAEVALPFSAGTGLGVAKTICVEGPRAVIAADELTWLLANAALVLVSFSTAFFLTGLQHVVIVAVVIVIDYTTACRVEQTLLEHVEALHVDLLENEH